MGSLRSTRSLWNRAAFNWRDWSARGRVTGGQWKRGRTELIRDPFLLLGSLL